MSSAGRRTRSLLLCMLAVSAAAAQHNEQSLANQSLANLVRRGEITLDGQTRHYVVRHLPPASFPGLPESVANVLNGRECLIPQTYQARQPENVVRGSFERPGSQDWAVLCTVQGNVSLLVFFASAAGNPQVLTTVPETDRLQDYSSAHVLGFNWGIDAASPEVIHDAQIGLSPRPPRPDHDALADSIVDRTTVYHYFKNGSWSLVDLPD
jgi:hypothetical protein